MGARLLLVDIPRDRCPAGTDKEIQITPFIGLQDVVDVHVDVTTGKMWWGWRPTGLPPFELIVGHVKVKSAASYIQFNLVAVLDQGERATRSSFRRRV